MSDFSPTGYWAHYLFTERFVKEVNAGVLEGSGRMGPDLHLPVVTWTPDGVAAVFDAKGKLTAVSDLYPASVAKHWDVSARPDWEA